MPKVYIVNKSGHDFDYAKRFGELKFLSEGQISKYAVDSMYRQFADRLRESSPDDYILITGLTVMSCIACSCFAVRHDGRLNLLLFRNNKYIERKMRLDTLLPSNKETERQVREIMEDR
jgi:hypothetical protein